MGERLKGGISEGKNTAAPPEISKQKCRSKREGVDLTEKPVVREKKMEKQSSMKSGLTKTENKRREEKNRGRMVTG